MKKSSMFIIIITLLFAVAPTAFAAATVTVNPMGMPSIEFEIDRVYLGPLATLNVFGLSGKPSLGHDFDMNATGMGIGVRYYLDGTVHDGIYLGGYASVFWLNGDYKGQASLARALVLSAASGYKWNFGGGFFIDFGARVGFPMAAQEDDDLFNAAKVFDDAIGTQVLVGAGFVF